MTAYIGTKIVQAEPMTRHAFETTVRALGQDTTIDESLVHDGYLVVYPDGYKSWCPKDEFERAYRQIGDDERSLVVSG